MAGELRSWGLIASLSAVAIWQPLGCDGTSGPDEVADEGLATALSAVGPLVVLPTLERALTASSALDASTAAWRETPGNSDLRGVAQNDFLALMAVWQELEIMQLGPAGSSLDVVGGQDLRDEVYSWTTVNPCRVDQELVSEGYASNDFFETRLVNVYGLDALDGLLFAVDGSNACSAQVAINEDGSWDALGDDEVQARRAAYAEVVAHGVHGSLQDLQDAWLPEGGDFSSAVATAGEADSPYFTQNDALNAVFHALFKIETNTKDRKLAHALGLRDCTTESCLDTLETPLAGGSVDWVLANVDGFDALFHGGSGAGLDDLLVERGHQDVLDDITVALSTVRAAGAEVQGPIDVAVATDRDDLLALHDALVSLTDVVKNELALVLTLEIPSEAAGDND